MKILGIDPGATSGWCLYDTAGFVQSCGTFREDAFLEIPGPVFGRCDAAVLERPVAHGPTRPQVVDCAWTAGQLWRDMTGILGRGKCHLMTRLEVSDRKPRRKKGVTVDAGGPLGEVKSHARAALAVAVAWWLRQKEALR